MSDTNEEKFFEQWYDKNEKRFHRGQFSEKQIAYSAFVNGFNYNREIISELEQQLSELKESRKQKQIIRLCNRLDKAEQQNKQLSIISKNCRGCVKGAFIDCEDCPIYENAVKFVTDKSIDELLK